jgi:hypothetical protein
MEEDKDKEKTFMENAKGFMKSWKDDYAEKNKDIIERKKQRDEEAEAEHQEFLKNLEAVKADLKGKAEKMANVLNSEFNGFMKALESGTASVHEKFQLQKHFDDFKLFLKKAEKAGAEKFGELTSIVEKNLSEVDNKKLSIDPPAKDKTNEFEEIMKQAETLINSDLKEKDQEIDVNQQNVNKLFDDLNKE